jgi:hypothetical protein
LVFGKNEKIIYNNYLLFSNMAPINRRSSFF